MSYLGILMLALFIIEVQAVIQVRGSLAGCFMKVLNFLIVRGIIDLHIMCVCFILE